MKAVRNQHIRQLNRELLIGLLLLTGSTCLNGQVGLLFKKDKILPPENYKIDYLSPILPLASTLSPAFKRSSGLFSKPPIPKIYSYDHLALFCKLEVRLEKAVKFPVKFRLGDIRYVDELEGKGQ